MALRQPLPRLWLMTDERIGDALWAALARLPRGSGVVFRHYATLPAERRRLYEAVRAVTRRRGLVLVLAGSPRAATAWRADGAHGRSRHIRAVRPMLRTAPAHDRAELAAAHRAGADLIFLSPVFPTRSHPGRPSLGAVRFGLVVPPRRPGSSCCDLAKARHAKDVPTGPLPSPGNEVIALGGMTAHRFRALRAIGAYGWAAIDALSRDQNLKVVPR
jgi:thiamine-phosphate pyrophosphorylase